MEGRKEKGREGKGKRGKKRGSRAESRGGKQKQDVEEAVITEKASQGLRA